MITRCDKHTDRKTLPALCHTCIRMAMERRIVTRTVDALLAAGFYLNIDNGGGSPELSHDTQDRALLLKNLGATDDEFLLVSDGANTSHGWVRFVYGNDGYDVISDYTTNLESVLAPVNAYADTLS